MIFWSAIMRVLNIVFHFLVPVPWGLGIDDDEAGVPAEARKGSKGGPKSGEGKVSKEEVKQIQMTGAGENGAAKKSTE